jgi:hypothetical protein
MPKMMTGQDLINHVVELSRKKEGKLLEHFINNKQNTHTPKSA